MADYYPLLARALSALPDRTPTMRGAVYERARNALIGQLRSLEPPLAESDIELERQALETAIGRLEVDYGGQPAAATPTQAPSSHPEPEPAAQEERPAAVSEPAFMPAAPPPSFLPLPERPFQPESPREPSVAITARKSKLPDPQVVAPDAEGRPDAVPSPAVLSEPDPASGRQRPRIDVVAPRTRSRLLRNALVGVVLTVVIGLIAVAAFLLRDKPANLQPGAAETAESQQPDTDAKFADRVGGGDPAPREKPVPGPTEPRTPANPAPPLDLAVAQRASLVEENTSAPNSPPTTTSGRVVWRLDSVAGEQGQPLETVVVANVTIPDAGLSLVMTIQRNLDATLPASHTISLAFTGSETRRVQDVGLLQAKDDEAGRGSPVSGLPVRVRENLFLIGLSSLKNDVDRNTDLLLHRPWFDLALRYASGQRAVVMFDKGTSGTQAMQSAFDQWR